MPTFSFCSSAAISPDRDEPLGEPTPPQRHYVVTNQMSQAPPTWNPMPTSARDPLLGTPFPLPHPPENSSKAVKSEEAMLDTNSGMELRLLGGIIIL